MIQFQTFKKQYGDNLVLDIPSFEIPRGIYWLKGINGSGKSTLLRSLAGLIPFDGQILIEGVDIKKKKQEHRKMLNYGEAAPLFPTFLTGMELINFYASTKKGSRQTCLEMCQQLNLANDALMKQIGAYSSGMLKKLSLALAFVGQPKWMLLDEPLITLDVAAIQVVLQLIDHYHQQGVGMIVTSHQDMDFENNHLPIKILTTVNKTISLSI